MLEVLASKHDYWIKIVNSFGEINYAEDVVQEMYIKLYEGGHLNKVIVDGEILSSGVWLTLRSVYYDMQKKRKLSCVSLGEGFETSDENNEYDIAYGKFLNLLDKEIDQWYWYDKKLFELYKDTEFSLRDIEDETKISLTSIFSTIKRCKQKVKDALQEDWEDLKNNDYELL